ncbi:MAG TPA: hypothetical protein VHL09_14210 [Dehalococcoidia bacterium]|nr:hypothetical protein [Dehalococcoidia bacterium]
MGETISAGGLEFSMENRTQGQDGGPSLRVYGTLDGQKVQILRFDMFHQAPHYHYDPAGRNLRYDLDPLTLDDGIGWVTRLLHDKLPHMIAKAGYEGLATPSSVAEVGAALPEIERRWRTVT